MNLIVENEQLWQYWDIIVAIVVVLFAFILISYHIGFGPIGKGSIVCANPPCIPPVEAEKLANECVSLVKWSIAIVLLLPLVTYFGSRLWKKVKQSKYNK